MVKECKHIIRNEIKLENGKVYDGCRKSRRDLPFDICDLNSEFCKNVKCKECLIDDIINELDSILDNENELITSLLYTLKSNRIGEEFILNTRNEIKISKRVINTVDDIKRRVKLISEEYYK